MVLIGISQRIIQSHCFNYKITDIFIMDRDQFLLIKLFQIFIFLLIQC